MQFSCWLLIVDCWLLVVGYWLLIIGCWLLIVGYWLLVVKYSHLFLEISIMSFSILALLTTHFLLDSLSVLRPLTQYVLYCVYNIFLHSQPFSILIIYTITHIYPIYSIYLIYPIYLSYLCILAIHSIYHPAIIYYLLNHYFSKKQNIDILY